MGKSCSQFGLFRKRGFKRQYGDTIREYNTNIRSSHSIDCEYVNNAKNAA